MGCMIFSKVASISMAYLQMLEPHFHGKFDAAKWLMLIECAHTNRPQGTICVIMVFCLYDINHIKRYPG